jgi:hypothetical protein
MEGDLFAVKERPACSVMAEEAMTCDSPLESSGLDRENGFFFRMSFKFCEFDLVFNNHLSETLVHNTVLYFAASIHCR